MDHLGFGQPVQGTKEVGWEEGGLRCLDPDGVRPLTPCQGFDKESGNPALDCFDQESVGPLDSVVTDRFAADRKAPEGGNPEGSLFSGLQINRRTFQGRRTTGQREGSRQQEWQDPKRFHALNKSKGSARGPL